MRVLLVDDHRVFLAGLVALLRGQDWVDEVLTSTCTAEAVEVARSAMPDVVVLDLALGRESGLDAIAPLHAVAPAARVLMLTMSADYADARDSVARGAVGYVVKDSGPEEVLAAIRVVASGGAALSAEAAGALLPRARPQAVRALPERDAELLNLLVRGLGTDEIARRLFLSPKTVRNRLSALYRSLGVSNRLEAVARAREMGW